MPRALRIEYPGATYHVMNCGDRRDLIFRRDLDHKKILTTLRAETTLTLKWIASGLRMETWSHVANHLSDKSA